MSANRKFQSHFQQNTGMQHCACPISRSAKRIVFSFAFYKGYA
jgi:hypothetical protein